MNFYTINYSGKEFNELLNRIETGEIVLSDEVKSKLVEEILGQVEEGVQGEKGEKGDKGDQGEVGPMGPEGPAGKDGADGTFDKDVEFAELETDAKTIIGAINELFKLLKAQEPEVPEEPVELANVYYGYFPYTIDEAFGNYADLKLEHIQHEEAVIEEAEGTMDKTSLGKVPEACFIVIAIKKELGLAAKKDDGFGGQVIFDESTIGANGVEVELDGQAYLVFGEYALIDGERFIYIV